jgi:hypothetical protein
MTTVRFDFARCRVLRHAWEASGETEDNGSKLLVLRCGSCGTMRYDRWNTRTGERWGKPSYIYPMGYQDREEGHDAEWWRVTYAEHLYSLGVIGKPRADTRQRAVPRASGD